MTDTHPSTLPWRPTPDAQLSPGSLLDGGWRVFNILPSTAAEAADLPCFDCDRLFMPGNFTVWVINLRDHSETRPLHTACARRRIGTQPT